MTAYQATNIPLSFFINESDVKFVNMYSSADTIQIPLKSTIFSKYYLYGRANITISPATELIKYAKVSNDINKSILGSELENISNITDPILKALISVYKFNCYNYQVNLVNKPTTSVCYNIDNLNNVFIYNNFCHLHSEVMHFLNNKTNNTYAWISSSSEPSKCLYTYKKISECNCCSSYEIVDSDYPKIVHYMRNIDISNMFNKIKIMKHINIPKNEATVHLKTVLSNTIYSLLPADLCKQTISSIVGANWHQTVNAFGTISGQDRVHPKAGLLTLNDVLVYYKNSSGIIDFEHFTTLKDLVNNVSLNSRRNNKYNSHLKSTASAYVPNAAAPPYVPNANSTEIVKLSNLVNANKTSVESLVTQLNYLNELNICKDNKINSLNAELLDQKNQIDDLTKKVNWLMAKFSSPYSN